jgi:Carboxypeptidase regulatory-like domain
LGLEFSPRGAGFKRCLPDEGAQGLSLEIPQSTEKQLIRRCPVKRFALLYFVAAVCVCALIATPAAWGQAATSLRGTITDPSGGAIPNARVHLINADTNLTRTTTSDAQGNYAFPEVQPGNYRLAVEVPGFARYQQTGIQLLVNLPATVNVKMKIGQAQETVTVTEEAPVINSTDASEGNTMGQLQLEQLPIEARDIVQLLSLQPGVVYTSDRTDLDTSVDTRSGAVNGEHSDQSNVNLDGVDDNQQATGWPFSPFSRYR